MPVVLSVTKSTTRVFDPYNLISNELAGFDKLVAYRSPANKTVPVVLLSSTKLTKSALAPTVPLNVIPPEFVTVNLPIRVPIDPLTDTAPVVCIVKFETAPEPFCPVTDDKYISPD